jgi:hypothetical protein
MFNNSDTILQGMRVGDVWLYHMGIMPQLNRKHFTVTALELWEAVKYKADFFFKHLLVQNKNSKQIYCFST